MSSELYIAAMSDSIEFIRPKVLVKVLVAAAIFMGTVRFLAWFIANHPDSPWRLVAAASPIAAAALCAAAAWSSLEGMDERGVRMHRDALAFAFVASLVFLLTSSFVALTGAVTLKFELIAPVMVIFWVIGVCIGVWRYR